MAHDLNVIRTPHAKRTYCCDWCERWRIGKGTRYAYLVGRVCDCFVWYRYCRVCAEEHRIPMNAPQTQNADLNPVHAFE